MRNLLLLLLPVLLFASCHRQGPGIKQEKRYADAALKAHFAAIDTLAGYDTTNEDYLLLRAYYRKDSTFFKNYLEADKLAREIQHAMPKTAVPLQYRMHLPPLQSLQKSRESYQFLYTERLHRYALLITVKDSTGPGGSLQYQLYRDSGQVAALLPVEEGRKPLTEPQWEAMVAAIDYADFWALREQNDVPILADNYLQVNGYIERPRFQRPDYVGGLLQRQSHSVYRVVGKNAIGAAFLLAWRLSGCKATYFNLPKN